MRKLLIALLALSCALNANAQWNMKARQVEVRTNNFETLQSVVDTNVPPYAPSNSVQAIFEWVDDNWGVNAFSTNNSYYYADGTTQNLDGLIVRGDLEVLGNLTATNWVDEGVDTNASYYFSDGTTQNFDNVVVRGDLDVQGDLTVSGDLVVTSNDMAVSFMGYPKVTLTTNMLTSAIEGGTGITLDTFTNAFDSSRATLTATGTVNNCAHIYELDLGANYEGYVTFKTIYTAGVSDNTRSLAIYCAQNDLPEANGVAYPYDYIVNFLKGSSTYTNEGVASIRGRYLHLSVNTEVGANETFQFYDLSVYAVTNSFRNMGGF